MYVQKFSLLILPSHLIVTFVDDNDDDENFNL